MRVLSLLLLLVVVLAWPCTVRGAFNHSDWDAVLKKYVDTNGEIAGIKENVFDYEALRRNQEPLFYSYLEAVEKADLSTLTTREDQLAFWINVYNAFAVKMVVENPCKVQFGRFCWPIRSIRDVGAYGKTNWVLPVGKVAGKTYSLDDVETTLRNMGDYRIHTCIVCASVSCPNLQAYAYHPSILDAQMNTSAEAFLNTTGKGLELNSDSGVATVSAIFDWFAADFEKQYTSVKVFLSLYSWEVQDFLKTHNLKELTLKYYEYDWRLNSKSSSHVKYAWY
ncbi:Zinc transporter [Balamuthia mandrillaris]